MADDTPQSLGEFLRLERERRSITLEQVASATKISLKVLQALEADHYKELPAKTFIRGFVTAYCRFIGLSAREVLGRYDAFIESRSQERPKRDSGHSGYAFERKDGEQTKTILWIIMGSFILFGGLVILIMKPNFKRSRHAAVAERARLAESVPAGLPSPMPSPLGDMAPFIGPAPAAKAVATAPTPLPSVAPPDAAAEDEKTDPLNNGVNVTMKETRFKAVFKIQEDIWVRYKVDDRPTMKFPMRKDGVLVIRARDRFIIQVSNANSLTYSLNGRGSRLLSAEKNLTERQSTATLGVPAQHIENIEDPFPGERPLPSAAPAKPSGALEVSPPAE